MTGRLPRLTSMRFYAALMVVAYHWATQLPSLRPVAPLVGHGYVAVSFFFVLSGFVLTWNHRPDTSTLDFYRRRLARIWPLHLLTTAAAVVLLWGAGRAQAPTTLALTLALLHTWAPTLSTTFAYNSPSWSLSCEAFFYVLFPLLVLPARRMRRVGPTVVVLALVVLVTTAASVLLVPGAFRWQLGYQLSTNPIVRLPEFVLGVLLAQAMRSGWRPRLSLPQALAVAGAGYLVLLALTPIWPAAGLGQVTQPVGNLVMVGPCALVIAAAATADLAATTGHLTHRHLVRLGEWSFAVYLCHQLVFAAAALLLRHTGFWSGLLLPVVMLGAVIALAGLLHRAVEQPCERRLRPRRRPATGEAATDEATSDRVATDRVATDKAATDAPVSLVPVQLAHPDLDLAST